MKNLLLALALTLLPSLQAADWKETLKESLPLLGHRNWIVIADSAYPRQTSLGVQTLHTAATQEEVISAVIEALAKTKHVKPTIYIDRELEYVSEKDAPGVSAYRDKLAKILSGSAMTKLPHEEIIAKLDESGKTFHVLLLKTNMTIPYTSVFLQLDCGYWNSDAESRLRTALRVSTLTTTMKASNPIIRHMYTADPSACVFDGRLYVYTSHDRDNATNYDMVDWWLFSTDDMVTWKDHGAVFKLEDFAWAKKQAWAPDAIAANGKYYLFLPTDRSKIGVAVSDKPDGPFVDAIGAPLIDNSTMPEAGSEPIDPAILVDDDGTTWLYFGCRQPMVAKLDPSLTKLAGPLQKLVILTPSGEPVPQALPGKDPQLPAGYGEGPSMFKRDGRYYLVYSNGWAKDTTLVYATSDSPTGPFTYQGRVMHPVDCSTHHGMVGEFRGKWYVFYHTAEVSGGNGYRRSVCVDELTFDADGKIIPVKATSGMK